MSCFISAYEPSYKNCSHHSDQPCSPATSNARDENAQLRRSASGRQFSSLGQLRGCQPGPANLSTLQHPLHRTEQTSMKGRSCKLSQVLRISRHTHPLPETHTELPGAYKEEGGGGWRKRGRPEKDPCVAVASKRWDGFLQSPDREPCCSQPTEGAPDVNSWLTVLTISRNFPIYCLIPNNPTSPFYFSVLRNDISLGAENIKVRRNKRIQHVLHYFASHG